MEFNKYIWGLYKSTDGERLIERFVNRSCYEDDIAIIKDYAPYYTNSIGSDKLYNLIEDLWCYNISEFDVPYSLDEAESLYKALLGYFEIKDAILLIPCMSMGLSILCKEYFIPYLFPCRFYELTKIADCFDIGLPQTPNKNDYYGRCMFYWELCKVFYWFRKEYCLSPEELWAFLYGLAPSLIPNSKPKIHNVPNVWVVGGRLSEKDKTCDFLFWQSNEETKAGDIVLFYETHPISSITSIWEAKADGVSDPLFYYYGCSYIGRKIDIPKITIQELKEDNYFSKHKLVKKNFQGVNGFQLSVTDYNEMLRILSIKGCCNIPTVKVPNLHTNDNIVTERDVETSLLEPFLESMGLSECVDYKRQIGIHAGRGHRIFPDYVVYYNDKAEEEYAKILIEVKFNIKNNKERDFAFLQAKSYALLLQSETIVICDKNYLWVYKKQENFDRASYTQYGWGDVKDIVPIFYV